MIAAKNGSLSIVKLLVSLGCDPYIEGWFKTGILTDASYGGDHETVRFLLGIKPKIAPDNAISTLAMAFESGHVDVVDLLLKNGKIPKPLGPESPLYPLMNAVQLGHSLIIEKLRLSMNLEAFVKYSEAE